MLLPQTAGFRLDADVGRYHFQKGVPFTASGRPPKGGRALEHEGYIKPKTLKKARRLFELLCSGTARRLAGQHLGGAGC
jgi:hypothetical protein